MNDVHNNKSGIVECSDLHVSIITRAQCFVELRSEWDQLIEESKVCSVFLTWEWLYTWWVTFSGNDTLCLVTVREKDGALVGIGPFYQTKSWHGSVVSAVVFLGDDPISSDYMDIITRPANEMGIAEAIFRELVRHAGKRGCLIFSDVLDDSLVCRFLQNSELARSFRHRVEDSRICPYIDISGGRESVYNGLSHTLRSIIRRKTKKQEQLGFQFVKVSRENEVDFYLQELFVLHQRCWNDRGRPGNFSDSAVRSFHAKVSASLFRKGRLRVFALVHDSVIAVLYGFEFKGQFFYFQSGYDPDWSAYSPGTVLMGRTIGEAIAGRLSVFDFLRGDENYKSMWATRSRSTSSIILIPRGALGASVYFLLCDLMGSIRILVKSIFRKSQGEG